MSYAKAKVEEYIEQLSYRAYVTDSLQLAAQNKYRSDRWVESLRKKQDTRTGDEIALDVIQKCGLSFGEE